MKVLFDCIVTQEPAKCSTTVQFMHLAEMLLQHEHVFIYWPIPDSLTLDQKEYYPKHPRIRYFSLYQTKDRMKEYNRIPTVLENMVAFNGMAWDWDVLITVRSTQVSMLRVLATSPRQLRRAWMKKILLIEDMMILSKKPTVAQSNKTVQDRLTIEAYLAADHTFIPAYHEKKWVLQIAKEHFSYARLKDVREKVHEVCHLRLSQYQYGLKDKFKYDGSRKLGLAFVGRLGVSDLELVNKIMTDQYILHSGNIKCFVCTVTEGTKWFDLNAVEVRHPNREEFWKIAREEMDLALTFLVDTELSLSKLEPILFGVPLLINKAPWSVGMLGESYPFFVSGVTEAYGTVMAFQKDFNAQYQKFEKWYQNWFIPEYTRREKEDGMYEKIVAQTLNYSDGFAEKMEILRDNEMVLGMIKLGGNEFKMLDLIRLNATAFGTLSRKVEGNDREERSLVFSTPWNEYRLSLMMYHGYSDASTELGHLKKVC